MTDADSPFALELSRRHLLAAAAVAGTVLETGAAEAETPTPPPAPRSAPPVAGLHLQFGADASSEITISWHSLEPAANPRVMVGKMDGHLEQSVRAETVSYVDDKSRQTVYAHHAKVKGLRPDAPYMYAATHDGADAEFGAFRTAPRGRARFTFTSFGDQGTPTIGKAMANSPGGLKPPFINDNLGSPAAAETTLGVERIAPLFHLFNGDLAYANLADDRVRAWWDFWENNSRSARKRPWMPSPGNHENELGNGPIGYRAYQTYFSVPEAPGQTEVTRGLWYAFTAGSVRVIALANDDVCYQDGGSSYVRGYSNGAQKAWLEAELKATRANRDIDWVVICMHQTAISTSAMANGADLGVREEWGPLFDRYGVDLVVCGHEHHYERSHPVRGREANTTLTPIPVARNLAEIDTSAGTVHMVLGGGGTSEPTHQHFYDPPQCRVITGVGARGPNGHLTPIRVIEPAPWSATRNGAHGYGFAAFTVDPGTRAGGQTAIEVVYYDVAGPDGRLTPFERFRLTRPRRDRA